MIKDIFTLTGTQYARFQPSISISFYEIYGGKLFDLLNDKNKLNVLEDKKQRIQIQGLEEREASCEDELLDLIEYGNSLRTTHATTSNDESSRSHAIC